MFPEIVNFFKFWFAKNEREKIFEELEKEIEKLDKNMEKSKKQIEEVSKEFFITML